MMKFDSIKERLESTRLRLAGERTEEETKSLLVERARRLAERRRERPRELLSHVLDARRGEHRLGLPLDHLDELRWVSLYAVPRVGPVVQGLFQVRGRIHALVDPAAFFGNVEAPGHGAKILVAVARSGSRRFGLRLDEILGPRPVYTDECRAGSSEHDIVGATTRDLLTILDLDRVAERPEVVIRSSGARSG